MNITTKFFIAGVSGIFIGKTIFDKLDLKKNNSSKELKKQVIKKDASCQTDLNYNDVDTLLSYKKDIDDINNNKYEWKLV